MFILQYEENEQMSGLSIHSIQYTIDILPKSNHLYISLVSKEKEKKICITIIIMETEISFPYSLHEAKYQV